MLWQVNLSVAIIPMSHQFGWNSSVAGLVQSSFFWGYALSQLPGGWLAKIFGGRLGLLTLVAVYGCKLCLFRIDIVFLHKWIAKLKSPQFITIHLPCL